MKEEEWRQKGESRRHKTTRKDMKKKREMVNKDLKGKTGHRRRKLEAGVTRRGERRRGR